MRDVPLTVVVKSTHRGTWHCTIRKLPETTVECGRLLTSHLQEGAAALGFPLSHSNPEVLLVCGGAASPPLDDPEALGQLLQSRSAQQQAIQIARAANAAGKEAVASGDYDGAKASFAAGIAALRGEVDGCGEMGVLLKSALLNNSAHVHLCLREWPEACAACDEVLGGCNRNGSNAGAGMTLKALFRRARALQGLGAPALALGDIERLLRSQPVNTTAQKLKSDLVLEARRNNNNPPTSALNTRCSGTVTETDRTGQGSAPVQGDAQWSDDGKQQALRFHVLLRSSASTPINFKLTSGVISVAAGTSVREFKHEIASAPGLSPHPASAMKLLYHGVVMKDHCLVGEYTGLLLRRRKAIRGGVSRMVQAVDAAPSLMTTAPLMILPAPMEVASELEVKLEVTLPNSKRVVLGVAPSTSLYDVKRLLMQCHGVPDPDAVELFCAQRRVPFPSGPVPSLASLPAPSFGHVEKKEVMSLRPCQVNAPAITVAEAIQVAHRSTLKKRLAKQMAQQQQKSACKRSSAYTSRAPHLTLLLLPSILKLLPPQ